MSRVEGCHRDLLQSSYLQMTARMKRSMGAAQRRETLGAPNRRPPKPPEIAQNTTYLHIEHPVGTLDLTWPILGQCSMRLFLRCQQTVSNAFSASKARCSEQALCRGAPGDLAIVLSYLVFWYSNKTSACHGPCSMQSSKTPDILHINQVCHTAAFPAYAWTARKGSSGDVSFLSQSRPLG